MPHLTQTIGPQWKNYSTKRKKEERFGSGFLVLLYYWELLEQEHTLVCNNPQFLQQRLQKKHRNRFNMR